MIRPRCTSRQNQYLMSLLRAGLTLVAFSAVTITCAGEDTPLRETGSAPPVSAPPVSGPTESSIPINEEADYDSGILDVVVTPDSGPHGTMVTVTAMWCSSGDAIAEFADRRVVKAGLDAQGEYLQQPNVLSAFQSGEGIAATFVIEPHQAGGVGDVRIRCGDLTGYGQFTVSS